MNTQDPPSGQPRQLAQLTEAVRAARADAAGMPATTPRTSSSGQIDQTVVAFNVFSRLLADDGLRSALYSLLRLTDYRFISIFRFQGGKATSVVHVDRQDLNVLQADEVPDTATYCCYVRDLRGAFVTADALADRRTQAHAARAAIRSYCGVPVLTPEGRLLGTLCHYDTEPRDPEQLDLELLLQVASRLSEPGMLPDYPASRDS